MARPVFGFFGMIAHWIDVAFLAEVARLRPGYSFVLIGECQTDVTSLSTRNNVRLLGRRPYESLPAYCAGFDAAMMLFKVNALTRHVNPIKMLEYLAAGLPVISTRLAEAQRFPQAITVVDTPERFAEACDRVILPSDGARRERLSLLVREESWDARLSELAALVNQHVHGIGERRAKASRDLIPLSAPRSAETGLTI
jgi:glycosyltransferase involved in cell wall biosynthesis